MQTQDVSTDFLIKFWPWLEANRKRLVVAVVVALLALLTWFFLKTQKQQKELAAGQAYTAFQVGQQPGTSPQQVADGFLKIAKEYDGTAAAVRAELQAAAVLFNATRYADAQAQFQNFITANSGNPLTATARLGVGACLESQGKLDEALTAYRTVTAASLDSMPAINARFAIGRIYELQGKLSEAVTAYQEVTRLPLAGSLAQEAGQRISLIQIKLAAAKPAPTPATKS